MDNKAKLALMKERLNKLEQSAKNIKCGGCLRKLRRQIKKMESV